MVGITIQTPCGPITVPIPGLDIPFPPDLNIFPLPFPPKLAIPFPDCDLVKGAIGAVPEPDEDSKP